MGRDETPEVERPTVEGELVADGTRWKEFANETGGELRRQLTGSSDALTEGDVERITRRLVEAIDDALEVPDDLALRIAGDVARIRAEGEGADVVALAWKRARERARRTAAIGAVTTIPSMIPVLGPAIAAMGIVADWRYVAAQQRDLVLEIAALFDVRLDDPTGRVRALFLTSSGAALAGSAVGEAVARVAARQVASRGLSRVVPGVGAVVAGAMNYASTVAIARAAIGRFGDEAGLEVRGIIPGVAHPAMEPLRRWIAEAPPNAPPPPEAAAFDELSVSEREELVDLAVVAAASGANGEERLAWVVEVLGLSEEEVQEARTSFGTKVRAFAKRFRGRIEKSGSGGKVAARKVWRRARSLARRAKGWRPRRVLPWRRKKGEPDADS